MCAHTQTSKPTLTIGWWRIGDSENQLTIRVECDTATTFRQTRRTARPYRVGRVAVVHTCGHTGGRYDTINTLVRGGTPVAVVARISPNQKCILARGITANSARQSYDTPPCHPFMVNTHARPTGDAAGGTRVSE
jgi:hypothetical protein